MSENNRGPSIIEGAYSEDIRARSQFESNGNDVAMYVDPMLVLADTPNQMPRQTLDQHSGPTGLMAMVGKAMEAALPTDQPWLKTDIVVSNDESGEFDPEDRRRAEQIAAYDDQMVQALLLGSPMDNVEARILPGFASAINTVLQNGLVIGNCLMRLRNDFTIQTWRLNQYTAVRDRAGNVLRYTFFGEVDPLALPDETLAAAGLNRISLAKITSPADRLTRLYGSYTHELKNNVWGWTLREELNGHIIRTERHSAPMIFDAVFGLVNGNHYGYGYFTKLLPLLRSISGMSVAAKDIAAMMASTQTAIDKQSEIQPMDLRSGPRSILANATVVGGVVQDIGVVRYEKHQDFAAIVAEIQRRERAFDLLTLNDLSIMPTQERTTREQTLQTVARINEQTGGQFVQFFDSFVPYLLRAARELARKQKLLTKLDNETEEVKRLLTSNRYTRLLTGSSAIAAQRETERIIQTIGALGQFGPEVGQRINIDGIVSKVVSLSRLDIPGGVILTPEQRRAEAQERANAAGMEAGAIASQEQGAQVAGQVLTNLTQLQ